MGTSKILIDGVGIDLTSDTVASDKMLDGIKGHDANGNIVTGNIPSKSSSDLIVSEATITVPEGYYPSAVSKTVASGTAGTPIATKSAVSNHAITVIPSVINTTGYITGGTKTGTSLSVAASELVSGTLSVTENGSKDVTNYKNVSVNVDYYKTLKPHAFKIAIHLKNWSTGANLNYVGIAAYIRNSSGTRTKIGTAYSDGNGLAVMEITFNASGVILGTSRNLSTYKYLDFDPVSTSYVWDTSKAGKVRNFISGTNISRYSQGNWDDATVGGSYSSQGIICEFECYFKAN